MNMEMVKKSLVIAGAAALTVTGANAADATIGVDFASSYVLHGNTITDTPVMQPYLEVEGLEIAGQAFTVGTWANYDFTSDNQSSEFSEIDYYISTELGAGFSLCYAQYTYPTVEGDSDKEAILTYGTSAGGIDLSLSTYVMLGGFYSGSVLLEGAADYAIDISDDLSASVGMMVGYQAASEAEDAASESETGFSNYQLKAGLAYALSDTVELTGSVCYIGELDDEVLDVDKEFVGMIGLSHSF